MDARLGFVAIRVYSFVCRQCRVSIMSHAMLNRFRMCSRLTVLGLLVVGCSRAPTGIAPPKLNPGDTAARALSEYDSNGDQMLTKKELQECPGLLASIDRLDKDGNDSISASELESELSEIEKQGAGLVAISCLVRRNAQPLEGATVKFVPETFLADLIKPASGITARDGTTSPSVADEELPREYRGRLHGVNCGIYRVVVTHPSFEVPAKFNTHTTIGRIITRRDHETLTIDL